MQISKSEANSNNKISNAENSKAFHPNKVCSGCFESVWRAQSQLCCGDVQFLEF